MGKDLSECFMLYGARCNLDANSRFTFESWKSQVSNAKNPGSAENCAQPQKPKQTQLRKTCYSAEETGPKLGVRAIQTVSKFFQDFQICLT